MRPIQIITTSFPAADTDALVDPVTLMEAGFLTLLVNDLVPPRFITIKGTGNESGVTFAVVGTDPSGETQTETITGPNNNTVTSTKTYASVVSIYASGATASNIEVGVAQSGYSQWIPLDIYTPNQVTTISASVSGTVNYSIQYTNEDPFDHSFVQQVVAHPAAAGAFTNASTSQTHFTTTLMRAVRYVINSGTGSIRLTITQQSTA